MSSLMVITSSSGASAGRFCGATVPSGLSSAATGGCDGSAGVADVGVLLTVRGVGPERPRPHTGQAPLP